MGGQLYFQNDESTIKLKTCDYILTSKEDPSLYLGYNTSVRPKSVSLWLYG